LTAPVYPPPGKKAGLKIRRGGYFRVRRYVPDPRGGVVKGRLSSSTLSRRIRQRIAPVATAAALLAMAAGLVACGGEDDDSATLRWFVAIQPGGSIQEVAKRCTEQ